MLHVALRLIGQHHSSSSSCNNLLLLLLLLLLNIVVQIVAMRVADGIVLDKVCVPMTGRRHIGLAGGRGQGQGLMGLVANIVLLAPAARPLMRQRVGAAVSYLHKDPVEQLQRQQGNHNEHHADGDADVDEDSHVAVEHGEQRVLVLVHHVHEYGKVGQVVAFADAVGAIRRLQAATVGRPGTKKET